MAFKNILSATGLTQKRFSELMGIPLRTVEDWNTGKRKAPEYVLRLIHYYLVKEGIITE